MEQFESLQLSWAFYRQKIKDFELLKEKQLLSENPGISSEELDRKIEIAINKKFSKESDILFRRQSEQNGN